MIDIKKKYETKDGREVELAWDDLEGNQKIGGRSKSPEGWELESWTADGCYLDHGRESQYDLIEVKEKKPKLLAYKLKLTEEIVFYPETTHMIMYFDKNKIPLRAPEYDREPNE